MGSSVPPLSPSAGSAASLVTTPQTGSPVAKSAVEQASEAARAAIAANGTAAPQPGTNQPRVAPGHPAGGQFARSTVKEVGAGAGNGAPEAGRAAPAADPAAPNNPAAPGGQEAPAGDGTVQAGAEGEEGDEQQQTGAEDEGEGQGDDDLRVLLPGREGDEEFEFVVEDPEAAERLRQLKNGYLRGNEVRALTEQANTAIAEVEEVRESIAVDPVGFAFDALSDNPDALEHLALSVITQPKMWERLQAKLAKLVSDPNELRIVTAEQKAQRAEFRETMQTEIAERRAVQANLQEVQATCAAMLPETMTPDQQRVAFSDMLRDLKAYADRYNLATIPVHEIPTPARSSAGGTRGRPRGGRAEGGDGRNPRGRQRAPHPPGSAPGRWRHAAARA
jgi:hypothetical protein